MTSKTLYFEQQASDSTGEEDRLLEDNAGKLQTEEGGSAVQGISMLHKWIMTALVVVLNLLLFDVVSRGDTTTKVLNILMEAPAVEPINSINHHADVERFCPKRRRLENNATEMDCLGNGAIVHQECPRFFQLYIGKCAFRKA